MSFKRIALVAAAASLAVACTAHFAKAADLPAKAPAVPSYFQYPTANGFFYGVSGSGMGGNASAGLASGTVVGGRFGVDAGYTGVAGGTFWFVEASASVEAMTGASGALSVTSSTNFEERAAVGVPQNTWASVLAAIPGLSSVAMPSIPTVAGAPVSSSPYAFAALYQDDVSAVLGANVGKDWLLSYGAGVGILNRLTNGMVLDTSVEWKHSASGMLVGSALVHPFNDSYLATARLKF